VFSDGQEDAGSVLESNECVRECEGRRNMRWASSTRPGRSQSESRNDKAQNERDRRKGTNDDIENWKDDVDAKYDGRCTRIRHDGEMQSAAQDEISKSWWRPGARLDGRSIVVIRAA
jgi:hypothetical protein